MNTENNQQIENSSELNNENQEKNKEIPNIKELDERQASTILSENQVDDESLVKNAVALKESPSFASLIHSESILRLINNLGFSEPTPVQLLAIPPALEGRDLTIQAKTGSGKTLAFLIPLLCRLENNFDLNSTLALIVVPTRELALQIESVFCSLSSEIKPSCLIGGIDSEGQIASLKKDARVVIGTPGRILDLVKQKILKLKTSRYAVLDEADEMLSMGFLEDIRAILSRLPDERQMLFVSATITPRVEMLAHSFLTRPQKIVADLAREDLPPIEHFYCNVAADIMAKPDALCDIIETQRPSSVIIFCNTRSDTEFVEAILRRRGFNARRINSDLSQNQRNKIMNKIRNDELQFLVATDIAARGLDIDQIDLVVNYSIHEEPETYIHRTGRTGRAGKPGRAISLVGPKDFGSFHFLRKVLEINFQQLELPSDQEVCSARLAHLYEIIRNSKIEAKPRDSILARKLLNEMGSEGEPSEELEEISAKLCRFIIEHHLKDHAKGLDEELAEETENPVRQVRDYRSDSPERNTRERRSGQYNQETRNDRRDNNRREQYDRREGRQSHFERERHGNRRNDRYQNQREERNRYTQERGQYRGYTEDKRRDRERNVNQRLNKTGQERKESFAQQIQDGELSLSPKQEVRLYIGQGFQAGMTSELFKQLATTVGDVEQDDIKRLTIREHYGFVDLTEPQASTLIANLNGIEYNGLILPIQRAALVGKKQQRPNRNEFGNQE